MTDIRTLSAREISKKVLKKEISAEEVFKTLRTQGDRLNGRLNAYITWNEKGLEEARKLDERISKGENLGVLAGVPVGVKDMICTQGIRTTAGSKMLSEFIPPYSATIVEKMKAQGAIVLGKCNQDEFAMGSSNETSFFGPCRNPWNEEYVSGGSSGGSAVSVATYMSPISLGTDTGGSIRQPAHFCGVVGAKPTYGRVSRYGVVAFASSLDQVGTFARDVEDVALSLEVISGYDSRDATSFSKEVPRWSKSLKKDIKNFKVGVIKDCMNEKLKPHTRKAFSQAVDFLKKEGASVSEVAIPYLKESVSVYHLIAMAEASSNLSRYDGIRYGYKIKPKAKELVEFYKEIRGQGFGEEAKRRILIGTFILSRGYYDAYYAKATKVRRLIQESFLEAFKKYDVLIGPTFTDGSFKLGDSKSVVDMYLNDVFTSCVNLAGLPGISVPMGWTDQKLPVGLQVIAPPFQEQKMLDLAHAIEKGLNLDMRSPHVL